MEPLRLNTVTPCGATPPASGSASIRNGSSLVLLLVLGFFARCAVGQSLSGIYWTPVVGAPQPEGYAAPVVPDGTAGAFVYGSPTDGSLGYAFRTKYNVGAWARVRGAPRARVRMLQQQ